MMVPRAYMTQAAYSGLHDIHDEKANGQASRCQNKPSPVKHEANHPRPPRRSVPDQSLTTVSSPVQIPLSNRKACSSALLTTSGTYNQPGTRDIAQVRRKQSAQELLSSTAIRPRRKLGGRKSQRLPQGDYVADFSKLLLEDIDGTDSRPAAGSLGNPQFEELFGHSADKGAAWKHVPESVQTETPLSVRSVSSESMPSLVIDDDLAEKSICDLSSPPPSAQRLSPDRRVRLLSTSEDCGDDHPLQHVNVLDPLSPMHEDTIELPMPAKSQAAPKSKTSSFRSNLTASLRALKSAAQTVSSLATTAPTTRPDDFLTRSIFSFAPELTDDKRPPPTDDPPSPALRRYLNPPRSIAPDSRSPAEFYPYKEYATPGPRKKTSRSSSHSPPPITPPRTFQLQTCIPSAVRSPNASSPPIWLGPDGKVSKPTPSSPLPSGLPKPSSPPTVASTGHNHLRPREPRENAAFLRILVAEMNMRRSGKFDDAMESHACVWLPPRKAVTVDGQGGQQQGQTRSGRERWCVYPAETIVT